MFLNEYLIFSYYFYAPTLPRPDRLLIDLYAKNQKIDH
jgi:hypothetical protein